MRTTYLKIVKTLFGVLSVSYIETVNSFDDVLKLLFLHVAYITTGTLVVCIVNAIYTLYINE